MKFVHRLDYKRALCACLFCGAEDNDPVLVPINVLIAEYLEAAAKLARQEGRADAAVDIQRAAARLYNEARLKDPTETGQRQLRARAELAFAAVE